MDKQCKSDINCTLKLYGVNIHRQKDLISDIELDVDRYRRRALLAKRARRKIEQELRMHDPMDDGMVSSTMFKD